MTKPYRYIIIPCLIALGLWALVAFGLQAGVEAKRERDEFVSFVRMASNAARSGNVALMRRLHLDDALLNDTALKQVFAVFEPLDEAALARLEPDFEGETYCWLRLPGSSVMYKLVRTQSGWFLHGDLATIEAW